MTNGVECGCQVKEDEDGEESRIGGHEEVTGYFG